MSAVVAFVSMFVDPSRLDAVLSALSRIDCVKEAYEVTGEFDIVSVVSVPDIERFRDVLKNGIMKIVGVKSTVTSIILNPSSNRTSD
ncbi:MAG TPA: Lrp/AsnC ligand binding domain-containing protein [Candidatus Bathyarchaeia archaeon]|jgi:DNA-binding Lrp family transcriptional regulator|nr:Lrp/AsnC ligand binding domain-containing protein [Candidatus Bathyarchaeia archaeon]